MSLEIEIKNLINTQSNGDTQLLSLRVPTPTVNHIDELASELGKTRSELIMTFIKGGIAELAKQLDKYDEKNLMPINLDHPEPDQPPRFFLLNTNYNKSQSDHYSMLENSEASAFYGRWKKQITNLKKNDTVFLYQSGHGICGYGLADGVVVKREHNGESEECYSQKLNQFISGFKPITAKACKDATKSKLVFRRTLVSLTVKQGEAILNKIEAITNIK